MEETEQNLHSGYGRGPGLDSIHKHHGNFPVLLYRDGCEQRGRVAFGGVFDSSGGDTCKTVDSEMIQSVTGVLEMPDEEEEDV